MFMNSDFHRLFFVAVVVMHILCVRLGVIQKTKVQHIPNRQKEFSGLHCALCVFSKVKQGLLNLLLCFINWKFLHYALSLKML